MGLQLGDTVKLKPNHVEAFDRATCSGTFSTFILNQQEEEQEMEDRRSRVGAAQCRTASEGRSRTPKGLC